MQLGTNQLGNFLHALQVLLIVLGYGLSCWGWGRLFAHRFCIGQLPPPWVAAFGLAVLIALGGAVNMFGIAFPWLLNLLASAGLLIAFSFAWRSLRTFLDRKYAPAVWVGELIWVVPTLLLMGFLAWHLAPQSVFNFHDDFEKYLSHPKRMLETGSVHGGPFDAVGSETLGGMAFLQGFIAANFALPMVATVDPVFSFGLLLAMLASACVRQKSPPLVTLLVLAVAAAFNPQAVNITAVYTASALLLLVMFGPLLSGVGALRIFSPWMGVAYAALLALKTSFGLVLAVHIGFLLLFLPLLEDRGRHLRSAAVTAGVFLVASLAWLIASVPWRSVGLSTSGSDDANSGARLFDERWDPFSTSQVFYGFGETWLHYTLLMALVISSTVVIVLKQENVTKRALLFAAGLAGPALSTLLLAFFSISGLGFGTSLRYASSALLASLMACLLALLWSRRESLGKKISIHYLASATGFIVIILAGFLPGAIERFRQIESPGSYYALSSLNQNAYLTYVQRTLGLISAERVRHAQGVISPGARVLVWSSLSFHVDFARNNVLNVNPWFLVVPWLDRPPGNDIEGWRQYFSRLGVHYLMVQYRGTAVRSLGDLNEMFQSGYLQDRLFAKRVFGFSQALHAIAATGDRVYDDGEIYVVRLRSDQ